ncbi:hypothetical protein [Prochlorococcus sp. MIT 0604]|uniref:hypothetical protein n=1 Tax=Prochlorococcus sp. MIT 0604 TaxID=1501268 RepID=UPI0004F927CF|nr:hypothetical protein [Prochlorococcus sp. MIT 0604]AIQ95511.1 hypothetical protein EW14_1500 [Prochlorococcus sp. MIT 0604]
MNTQNKTKYFDKIYVGTGPILFFDAINETCKGNKVLLIDKSDTIGGAWKLINIDGMNNLENAVHYLIPNKNGYNFLNKILKISLIRTPRKFYAQELLNNHILLPNNLFGEICNSLISEFKKDKFIFKNVISNIFRPKSFSKSKYPRNGSKTIIIRMLQLSKLINLKIKLKTSIEKIYISKNNLSKVKTCKETFLTKEIIISHGFLPIKDFFIDKQKININKKKFRRPSLHIVFSPKNENDMKKLKSFVQVIFEDNLLIKYVHEISHYIPKENQKKGTYVIVVALKHDLQNERNTYEKIKNEFQKYKLIPSDNNLNKIFYYWQDIFLPLLLTSDLKYLESLSNGKLKIMLTEELNRGFGLYSQEWKELKNLIEKSHFSYI